MKKICILLVLIITASANAQWFSTKVKGNGNMVTKNRTVDEYDKVSVAGSFDVKLVSGKEGNLTIHIDENLLEYLITEVEGDNLKIKWEKGVNISSNSKILITVPYEDIEAVSLAGSGDVYNEGIIKAQSFKSALAGSGDIKLNVQSDNLKAAIAGSGDIMLSGSSKDFECSIAGSGDFKGLELNTTNASISIAGSGDAKLGVSDNLKVRVSGSGDVVYNGNPKQDVKISGSGSVRSN